MIVIIGGMPRSGSTFSFNIAREILSRCGGVSTAAVDTLDEANGLADGAQHLVIKTHNPEPKISNLINTQKILCICTSRKPEDAIASWMHTFGGNLETSITNVESWLEWYSGVSKHALHIDYVAIDHFPLIVILKIQKYILGRRNLIDAIKLWHKYNKRQLKRKSDNLEESTNTKNIGISYYDTETFLHRQHISSIKSRSACAILTSENILLIRERLKDFVDQNGNSCVEHI